MRDKILKIGIVGCGAIGASLARSIVKDFSGQAELSALCDIDTKKAYGLELKLKRKIAVSGISDLIKRSDLVIEATQAGSAFDIAKTAISASRDVMVMSVGGIVNRFRELKVLAKKRRVNIFIPSGAVCGIDGLKAAACGKIKRVTLTTRKPPQAFSGVSFVLKRKMPIGRITKEAVVFEGSALRAIRLFPQNINVAATLSMAGIGLKDTRVRILASPGIKRNMHEIEIESEAGRIFTRTENIIHPENPKTSYLAVLSAVATLRQILDPVRLGT